VAGTADGSEAKIFSAVANDDYDVTELASTSISGSDSGDWDRAVSIGRLPEGDRWYFQERPDLAFSDNEAHTESELQSFVDHSKATYE